MPTGSCPNDESALLDGRRRGFVVLSCGRCRGRFEPIGLLRIELDSAALDPVVRRARAGAGLALGKTCPRCARRMQTTPAAADAKAVVLDVCLACDAVWFDGGEKRLLPAKEPIDPELERARTLARLDAETRVAAEGPADTSPIAAALRLSAARPSRQRSGAAVVSWVVGVACGIASVLAWRGGADAVARWGVVSDRDGYVSTSTLTAFFVQRDGWSLAWVLFLVWQFGVPLERRIGGLRFAAVLGACVVGGDALRLAVASSTSPWVGAVGGMSGEIAAFSVVDPRATWDLYLPTRYRHRLFAVPLPLALALLVGEQAWKLASGPSPRTAAVTWTMIGGELGGVIGGALARWLAARGTE